MENYACWHSKSCTLLVPGGCGPSTSSFLPHLPAPQIVGTVYSLDFSSKNLEFKISAHTHTYLLKTNIDSDQQNKSLTRMIEMFFKRPSQVNTRECSFLSFIVSNLATPLNPQKLMKRPLLNEFFQNYTKAYSLTMKFHLV